MEVQNAILLYMHAATQLRQVTIRIRIYLLARRNLLWDILRLPSSCSAALGLYVILTLWRIRGANQPPYTLLLRSSPRYALRHGRRQYDQFWFFRAKNINSASRICIARYDVKDHVWQECQSPLRVNSKHPRPLYYLAILNCLHSCV